VRCHRSRAQGKTLPCLAVPEVSFDEGKGRENKEGDREGGKEGRKEVRKEGRKERQNKKREEK